ncbi:MAG: pyrroline-5-carboxylate reductase [Planctomycetaceae bacterium]|nr:pyrroline-5-carboxylate reductase [Planctomycetaceae bacterium]
MSSGSSVKIGFIGAGRMATALATGLIDAAFTTSKCLVASDVSEEARQRFSAETGGATTTDNSEVLGRSEVIVLAVKPQQISEVLKELHGQASPDKLFVSIAAGVPLGTLQEGLGSECRLVRVMPNSPCLVQAGASAFACGEHASKTDAELVSALFSTVGIAIPVPESYIDAVTGLSGSGPAYGFQIIEALSDGGVKVGLPRDVATRLAAQTLLGAARMVLETGQHPGSLKDAVTSPGGTTIAGLHAMERAGIRAGLIDAVESATMRSIELGRS